jgi:penicillin-binding protein 1A
MVQRNLSSWEQTKRNTKRSAKRRQAQRASGKKRSPWRIVVYILLGVLCLLVIGLGIFAYILYTLPLPQDLSFNFSESSQILDRNGKLIATYSPAEKRVYRPLAEISSHLQDAILAIEDHRFYEHSGIDINGFFRAAWGYVTGNHDTGGGSTITQQLAREAFLTKEATLTRKIKEMMVAFRLEQKYSKNEILESYLNAVYFGQMAYGAEAASLTYFGKHAIDVSIAEAAWLAGVINAPSILGDPAYRTSSIERQRLVLYRMKTYGFIDEATYDQALNTELVFTESAIKMESDAPYFTDLVREKLEEKYSSTLLIQGGMTIYTTLDLQMQRWANEAMTEAYQYWIDEGEIDPTIKDEEGVSQPQGALIALDPRTGDILAMVGGRDWYETPYNRTLVRRQPGSSFKIFDYTAAIDRKIVNPATILVSEEIKLPDYNPTEYTGELEAGSKNYYGPLSVKDAIIKSSNIIAIKVSLQVGLDNVIDYAHRLGVSAELQPYYSMPIGSQEIMPIEMAQAYGVLATGGQFNRAIAIRRVVDRDGNLLEESQPEQEQVLSPATAYVMTSLFKNVYQNTGRAYVDGLTAAGKTGTTDRFQYAWFIGYTPDIVVATYNGNDTPDFRDSEGRLVYTTRNIGAGIPSTIWHNFMVKAQAVLSGADWEMPAGIVAKDGFYFLAGTENMPTKTPTPTTTPSSTTRTPTSPLPPVTSYPSPSPSYTPTYWPTLPPGVLPSSPKPTTWPTLPPAVLPSSPKPTTRPDPPHRPPLHPPSP